MSEHTPGPWHAVAPPVYNHGNPWTVRAQCDECTSGHSVAIITHSVGGKRQPSEANARLIAAAPDLLDALKGITRAAELEDWDIHADNGADADLTIARAAIAKAEGREPNG